MHFWMLLHTCCRAWPIDPVASTAMTVLTALASITVVISLTLVTYSMASFSLPLAMSSINYIEFRWLVLISLAMLIWDWYCLSNNWLLYVLIALYRSIGAIFLAFWKSIP